MKTPFELLIEKINKSKNKYGWIDAYVNNLEVNDKLYNRPIVKVTANCICIYPTCPTGKKRYTKKEIISRYKKRGNI
jgi:hypothetical protein